MNALTEARLEYTTASGTPDALLQMYLDALPGDQARGMQPLFIFDAEDSLQFSMDTARTMYGTLDEFTRRCLTRYPSIDPDVYAADESEMDDIAADDDEYDDAIEDGLVVPETLTHIYLAHIPCRQPYEVFARIPFGGWNCCPENEAHIAFAKRWYDQFGALPLAVGADTVQYYLPQLPQLTAQAKAFLNAQLMNYCPTLTEYIPRAQLAPTYAQTHVWYFFYT